MAQNQIDVSDNRVAAVLNGGNSLGSLGGHADSVLKGGDAGNPARDERVASVLQGGTGSIPLES